jgi:peptidoglycan/LPS O-acetylase OafA/YrhL
MKRTILVAVIALMAVVSFIIWIINTEISFDLGTVLMILIPVVILAFAVIRVVQGITDAKYQMPAEDELSKMIMLRTGSTAFQLSLFLWLVIGGVEDRIELEGHTIIGAGILGMAILFALSWIFHRFIRKSHD